MKIETIGVWGFKGAFSGMRNPLKSYAKADSNFLCDCANKAEIGANDMKLAQNLISAGQPHSKFLRFIHVQADITAPRYFWSEFDTYKFVEKNSESTMHTLLTGTAPITADIFGNIQSGNKYLILQVIEYLNILKDKYQTSATAEEKCEILQKAKQILPESFLQKRTIDTNYAELRNMYFQRRDHRLPEWRDTFCNWVKTLPYTAELITYEGGV